MTCPKCGKAMVKAVTNGENWYICESGDYMGRKGPTIPIAKDIK